MNRGGQFEVGTRGRDGMLRITMTTRVEWGSPGICLTINLHDDPLADAEGHAVLLLGNGLSLYK